jgi:hypothetical protein
MSVNRANQGQLVKRITRNVVTASQFFACESTQNLTVQSPLASELHDGEIDAEPNEEFDTWRILAPRQSTCGVLCTSDPSKMAYLTDRTVGTWRKASGKGVFRLRGRSKDLVSNSKNGEKSLDYVSKSGITGGGSGPRTALSCCGNRNLMVDFSELNTVRVARSSHSP